MEHPILFSGEMVRAILDGKKTQTRRVIRFREVPEDHSCHTVWLTASGWQDGDEPIRCPYGKSGDMLWVRETFTSLSIGHVKDHDLVYPSHHHYPHYPHSITIYRSDGSDFPKHFYRDGYAHWKPGIHMHRYESRIALEIVKVRVERVQDITDDDAIEEGVDRTNTSIPTYARQRFEKLWNSINEKRGYGWETNPWCWVIEFKRITP